MSFHRKTKTPYGKAVKVKPKPKVVFVSPMRMSFLTWALPPDIRKFPDPEELIAAVKSALRLKKTEARLPEGFQLYPGTYFSEVPRTPRTLVFRLESWDDGQRIVELIAKSQRMGDGDRVMFVPVANLHRWDLSKRKERS